MFGAHVQHVTSAVSSANLQGRPFYLCLVLYGNQANGNRHTSALTLARRYSLFLIFFEAYMHTRQFACTLRMRSLAWEDKPHVLAW